jgi:asparagine synthase (glutamine-hydrolysing)
MGAIYGFLGPKDPKLLARMSSSLRHRGTRFTEIQTETVSLGHRENPHPAWLSGTYEREHAAVTTAGWIRHGNRPISPRELVDDDLLGCAATLSELSGDFVSARFDGTKLRLVRDAAGIRTVYWARAGDRWLFASEPKAILAVPDFERRLRVSGLAQYLTFSFLPGEPTLLEGLRELPAGHFVDLRADSVEAEAVRYFHFEALEPPSNDESSEEWINEFRERLGTAVTERLPVPTDAGVFLSGGLDSSAVVAELAERTTHPIRTWSIHFGKNYANELAYAREVAHRWRTDHEEIEIRPKDFIPRLRQAIWHLDDPIGDPITVPNFELARRAAKEVRFIFNGEGGDPLFGGPKNIPMLLHHWYGGIDRGPRFRERLYLESYRRAFGELRYLLTPEALRATSMERDLEGLLSPFFDTETPRHFLNKLCSINIRLKGAHLILPKVERMLGAHGLVSLSPLFDKRLIELSFAMPTTLKLHHGVEKVIIKRAFEDRLPTSVLARPKSGMRVPVHYWFRKEIRRFAQRLFTPERIRSAGLFRPERIKELLDYSTEDSPGRHGIRLWMLMTFELWRRMVIEGEAV